MVEIMGRRGRRRSLELVVIVAGVVISLVIVPSVVVAGRVPGWKETAGSGLALPTLCEGSLTACHVGALNSPLECVALKTSRRHCGACNNTCSSAMSCCNGQCVDLASSTSHCGACGQVCGADAGMLGTACNEGVCVCPPGEQPCFDDSTFGLPHCTPVCKTHPARCLPRPESVPANFQGVSMEMEREVLLSGNVVFRYIVTFPEEPRQKREGGGVDPNGTPISTTGRSGYTYNTHTVTRPGYKATVQQVLKSLVSGRPLDLLTRGLSSGIHQQAHSPKEDYVAIFAVQVPDTLKSNFIVATEGPGGAQAELVSDEEGAHFLRFIHVSPPSAAVKQRRVVYRVILRSMYPQRTGTVTITTASGRKGRFTICTPGY